MFTTTHFLLSLCTSCAYAAFVPPQRLDVPVVLSSGGRPLMGVSMGTKGVGTVQNFNFTLTTSSGFTSVANNGCSDCSNTPLYDMSLSPNAKNLDGSSAQNIGAGNWSGPVIKENCSLSTSQGNPWSYTNQTIVLLNNQSAAAPFDNGVTGLVGLGTLKKPSDSTGFPGNFNDSIYGQYYIRNPEAANFTFGMALKPSPVIPGNSTSLTINSGASSLADQDVGTIHWLQPDSSAYDPNKVEWVSVDNSITQGYITGNGQPDLTVQLNGWAATIGTNHVGNGAGIHVNVDPYYSGIYLPGSQARLIHDAISGSQLVQLSTIPGHTVSWQVPCDTSIQFQVSIGSQQFTVDQSILVVNRGDGTCVSLIEGFSDSSVTQYIFGQTWISQLYIIFNIPKSGDPQLAFAPRTVSSSKSRDIGAIVGGTVGGVAGIVALGLLGFYLIRRKQDKSFFKRAAEMEEEHKVASNVEPYTFGQSSTDPRSPTSTSFGPQTPGQQTLSGYSTSPVSPHLPLLGQDLNPMQLPPSYEEASENGGQPSSTSASRPAYPREKVTYRSDTTNGAGTPPLTPNRQESFSGAGSSSAQ